MKVVCDQKIPFLPGALEHAGIQVEYLPPAKITPEAVRHADALFVRTRTRCDARLLDAAAVRFIATCTIGFDHLDTEYLAKRGIAWASAPGCNAQSVAQYVAAVLASLGIGSGKTLGIVGVGHVGRAVERVALAIGMRVLRNDPPRAAREGSAAFVPLRELLATSDAVTVHVPGGDATRNLAGLEFFAGMKPDALFINTSRGTVADPAALASRWGPLVLDVWPGEPDIDRALLEKTVFGTPHIAGYSSDGKANGTAMGIRAFADFFGIEALRDFDVRALPPPGEPDFRLPERDQIRAAILHTYDPAEDTAKLRRNPALFETIRNDYPVRREFHAFSLHGAAPENLHPLSQLGFNIEEP
ncbi:MAG: 4-phosphoerythronate dehydrogenase [Victivallaceae bacterium]|nr:4-phosphoerythronate dehydrogenase [Victivallaceae bacterium]